VAEYENELKRFATGEVTPAELASSKEALVRGVPSALETNDAVAGAMSNLAALGLPLDYYLTLPGRIGQVGQADVRRVVTKWVKPEQWPIVIVGPVGQSKEALEKLELGPVNVAPAPGTPPAKPASAGGVQ
jgi:predicted Zn-dependent peptidase